MQLWTGSNRSGMAARNACRAAVLLGAASWIGVAGADTRLVGAERTQPVVARVAMRLPDSSDSNSDDTKPADAKPEEKKKEEKKKEEIIEKGDLLTVLEERDGTYVIQTFEGRRGLVDQANVVELEQSVELYDELIKSAPKNGRLYTLRAAAWWAGGKHVEALADFDRALEAGYKQPHVYVTRGLIRSTNGD